MEDKLSAIIIVQSELEILHNMLNIILTETEKKINSEKDLNIIEKNIKKISETLVKMLFNKDILKKSLFIHNMFEEYLISTEVYNKMMLKIIKDADVLFNKITTLHEKINNKNDGIITKWNSLKNKNNYKNNDKNIIDNATISNTDKVWDIYNQVKETFIKIFKDEKNLEKINISWEDLIKNKLFTEENYKEKNIITLENLKELFSGDDSDVQSPVDSIEK